MELIISKSPAHSIFKNSGSLKNMAYAVFRHNGRLYAANELGALIWDGRQNGFQLLKGSDQPAYVFGKFKNDLFVGTNDGAYRISGNSLQDLIIDGSIKFIIDSKIFLNRMYLGTYDGFSVVEKINNKYLETYFKELPDETIKLIEGDNGDIWIFGFFPELIRVSGELKTFTNGKENNVSIENFSSAEGLHGNIFLVNKIREGILSITDEGIFIFDENSNSFKPFDLFGKELSDPDNQILLIEKGQNDDLWILAEVNNKISLGKAKHKSDGNYDWKPIPELWRIDLSSVVALYSEIDKKTLKEKLWVSTQDGLVLYTGDSENLKFYKNKPLIRKVKVNGDSTIYGGANLSAEKKNLELKFSENDISFEYSSVQYDKPNSTYFQTFLEGDEENWSDWSLDYKKNFTNLSQGDYKFLIKAKNVFGIITSAEPFAFTILAPWYLTWWAYVLYASIIGGTLFSIRKLELNRKDKNNRLRMSELKAEAAEFQAKAAETQAKLMQAEIDRKTEELEEARALQISMLPKTIPQIEGIEIAVFMQTATEVGGDYYDFSFKDDGSLNICLGDATGHGMKAGTLVSMMKSIFTVDSHTLEIDRFFSAANNALKNMSLGKMMMAFGMINIYEGKVKFCNAGIPPFYLIQNNKIEELELHGMPLGAMKNLKYSVSEKDLNPGDVVFIMSDGFPELQNEAGEMFGYDQFNIELEKVKELIASEIITHFKELYLGRAKIKEPDDDVTFVVIKIK